VSEVPYMSFSSRAVRWLSQNCGFGGNTTF